jgi:hypothetical protein
MADPAAAVIDPIALETIRVPIVGETPLIVHKFSEKAKRQMLDAQQGRKKTKEVRDPQADYESSMYRTKDGFGFPAVGFKACTVSAARFYGKDVTMTQLRQLLYFRGVIHESGGMPLVDIDGEPHMREDVVRIGQGTDLRYRAEFSEWSAVLEVSFVTTSLARESVLSLIDAGGTGVGVGEWRPEKSGEFGRFRIDTSKELEVVQ